MRTTWVSQREIFLYPHAIHLTNGSFVARGDPSVFEPFRPEHGSSSYVKTVQFTCAQSTSEHGLVHLQCVVSFLQMVPKSALSSLLFLVRPFCMVFVSGLSQSHLPCLQQKLFSDPNPWTAKTEMYSLLVFLRQPVTRSCSTATFWQNLDPSRQGGRSSNSPSSFLSEQQYPSPLGLCAYSDF